MVGLGEIPLEILEDIVRLAMSSGTSGPVGQMASVNSVWQTIVESETFQQLRLDADDVGVALRILHRRPGRFALVRRIIFSVVLPMYSAAACRRLESPDERSSNNMAFTRSINILLTYLAQWPSTGKNLELQLSAFSPADARCIMGYRWVRYWHGVVPGDILHNRMYGATLELLNRPDTPVPAITKFTIRDDCERYLAVSSFDRLFRVFTGLRDIDFRYWDIYKHDPDHVRREFRRQMAKVLDQMSSSVSSMRFSIAYSTPADQTFQGQRTCESDDHNSDSLTIAFRNATQKMTAVDVHGMLGTPELFWPAQVSEANPAPSWPNLKYMELYYHILDPTGEWLFDADTHSNPRVQADLPFYDLPIHLMPQEDIQPIQNRFTADQEKTDAFYNAVAKAVGNMPKLKYLHVQAITFLDGRLKPLHAFTLTIEGRVAHAVWSGSPPFEPSVDVLKLWRKMAYERSLILTLESKDSE
ncbi:hypothetical protein F5Y01DRAFT_303428 [Xylaria sp. FL0043]|nr:hypothetical protein F5Y01DRAFT_303428 [Xylaria sp. FL0043]